VWRLQDETLLIHFVNLGAVRPKFTVKVRPTSRVDRGFRLAVHHFAKEAPWTVSIEDIRVLHGDTMARVRTDQTFQEIDAEDGDELLLLQAQSGD